MEIKKQKVDKTCPIYLKIQWKERHHCRCHENPSEEPRVRPNEPSPAKKLRFDIHILLPYPF